jgi:Undecaprenyl-phosphate glucose phosphotransferase
MLEKVFINLIKSIALHFGIIFTIIVVFRLALDVSRLQIGYTYIGCIFLFAVWRVALTRLIKAYRKSGRNYRRIVILGGGASGLEVKEVLLSDQSFGIKLLGFFDDIQKDDIQDMKYLGEISKFKPFSLKEAIDEVYIVLPNYDVDKVQKIIEHCENQMIRVKIIPDFKRYIRKKVTIDFLNNIPVLLLRTEPLESAFSRLVKRTFDILFSFLVITLILSWAMPIIAICIRISSPGPIFFKQLRSGKDNREFLLYKFRTMRVNKDSDKVQATKNDVRVTRCGSFLRKSNLDELPQFINVLLGDMSVVGPRPHMLKHTEEYSAIINKYMVRHFVKPGITGYAQTNGYRGETKTPEMMEKRVEFDVYYLENWSILFDLKIILNTVYNMFKGEENAF